MTYTDEALSPYYVAYARTQGRTPLEQEEFDRKAYPGGCMAGFIVWIGEQKRAFAAVHPEAMRGHDILDHFAWSQWLAALPGGAA